MKDFRPLVSILIPCYNVEAFVEKATNSILQQTYQNLEILIIDDGSSDNTLQIINSFTDDRIKIIAFSENTQKIGAVNETLKIAKGDLIAFQDADDWSEISRIEEQVKAFSKDQELGICFTNCRYVSKRIYYPKEIALTDEALRNEFLNFTHKRVTNLSATICGTMMISRQALESTCGYHPYFAGRAASDVHWVYKILKSFKGVTINTPLYNYYFREGSITSLKSSGKNRKYAYSWHLLARIIYQDIHEGIDVLNAGNNQFLKELELEACEDALVENIKLVDETRQLYENSASFKIGRFLLTPWRLLKIKN